MVVAGAPQLCMRAKPCACAALLLQIDAPPDDVYTVLRDPSEFSCSGHQQQQHQQQASSDESALTELSQLLWCCLSHNATCQAVIAVAQNTGTVADER